MFKKRSHTLTERGPVPTDRAADDAIPTYEVYLLHNKDNIMSQNSSTW